MTIKPWYKIVIGHVRISGKVGRLMQRSSAVHLDHVRDGRATDDSGTSDPKRFFDSTYLTKNRQRPFWQRRHYARLSGETTETSAVFNMPSYTSSADGKTHALTLLYHLAKGGESTHSWSGVSKANRVRLE